jgi:hypothetical protein
MAKVSTKQNVVFWEQVNYINSVTSENFGKRLSDLKTFIQNSLLVLKVFLLHESIEKFDDLWAEYGPSYLIISHSRGCVCVRWNLVMQTENFVSCSMA